MAGSRIMPALSQLPLLLPAVSLAGGICAASALPQYSVYGAALMAALFVCLYAAARHRASSACLMLAIGMLLYGFRYPQQPVPEFSGEKEVCVAELLEVKYGDFSQRAIASGRCPGWKENRRMLLYVHSALPQLEPGDRVACAGVRCAIERPCVEGELVPGGFALDCGVLEMMHLQETDVAIVEKGSGWRTWIEGQRRRFSYAIAGSGFSAPAAAFLNAVLTGDDSLVESSVRERFAAAGVAHILALSGTHVAVVALFTAILLFPLSLAGHSRWALGAGLAVLWGYAVLTGLSTSVVRAAIMATMLAGRRLLGVSSHPINSLCAAAMLIMLADPRAIFGIGFMLSFAAVGSMLMFVPLLDPGSRVHSRIRSAWMFVASCGAAVAGTAPITVLAFHCLPLYFLPANIVVAPLLPLLMATGGTAVALHAAGVDASSLCRLTDLGYSAIEGVCRFVNTLPGGMVENICFSVWMAVIYYALLVFLWLWAGERRRVWGYCFLITIVVGAAISGSGLGKPIVPRVEAFSPAHRYATVVVARSGHRCYVLTDAGHSQLERLKESYPVKFEEYLVRTGCGPFEFVDEIVDDPYIFAKNNYWALGKTRIALASDTAEHIALADILLVPRGFRGSATEAARRCGAREVVLSPALSQKRKEIYAEELRSSGLHLLEHLPRRIATR